MQAEPDSRGGNIPSVLGEKVSEVLTRSASGAEVSGVSCCKLPEQPPGENNNPGMAWGGMGRGGFVFHSGYLGPTFSPWLVAAHSVLPQLHLLLLLQRWSLNFLMFLWCHWLCFYALDWTGRAGEEGSQINLSGSLRCSGGSRRSRAAPQQSSTEGKSTRTSCIVSFCF